MRGAADAEMRPRSACTMRSVAAQPLAGDRPRHVGQRQMGRDQRNPQVAGHQHHHRQRRAGARGEILGVAGEGEAGVMITLFCTGAVTIAANSPFVQPSQARSSIRVRTRRCAGPAAPRPPARRRQVAARAGCRRAWAACGLATARSASAERQAERGRGRAQQARIAGDDQIGVDSPPAPASRRCRARCRPARPK